MISRFRDISLKGETVLGIVDHVKMARMKHEKAGVFAYVLLEEIGEIFQALDKGDEEHARREALDAIAVLIRFIEGDER